MGVAKDLLRRRDISVGEVAERVGYGSASTFSTAFSRHVGQLSALSRERGQLHCNTMIVVASCHEQAGQSGARVNSRGDFVQAAAWIPLVPLVPLVAFAVLVARPGEGADQGALLTRYSLNSWHEGDGNSLGSVRTIAEDHQGYLWIGADAGLFRFDGWRFKAWNTLSNDFLPESSVTALWVTRDGSMWVGFGDAGGVYHIRDGSILSKRSSEHELVSASDIIEDSDGTIWAISDGALYRRTESWEPVALPWQPGTATPLSDFFGALHLNVSRRGELWVGTKWGVFRRDLVSKRFEPAADGVGIGLSEDADGTFWIADGVSGFRRLGSVDRPKHGWYGTGNRLLHDRQGNLWVATIDKGLWLARNVGSPQTFLVQQVGVKTGLSSDSVHAVFEDHDGNIWIGTTAGLHRLAPRELTPAQSIQDVLVLERSGDGAVWAGSPNGLTQFRFASGNLQELRKATIARSVRALYDDGKGTLWVGTLQGLWRMVGNQVAAVRIPFWSDKPVFSIAPDSEKGLWLCDGAWLYRWDGSHVIPFNAAPKSAEFGKILFVRADSRGRIWVVFDGGRFGFVEAGTFHRMDEGHGIKTPMHQVIYDLHEDDDGEMWIGGSAGLTHLSKGRFTTLSHRQGLPEERIKGIVEDREGYFWLSIDRGLLRVHRDEVAKAASDAAYRIHYRLYGALDGLAGMAWGLFGGVRADDGSLWFIRGGGLTFVDPNRLRSRPPPALRIESVMVNDQHIRAIPVTLGPGTRRLQIDYTALSLTASHKIRFRYRLEGLDTGWVDAGTRRVASYANLLPGGYRFHVEAIATDGQWDSKKTTWAFQIQPAYYETNWFKGLGVVAAIWAIWLAWLFRLRFVRRQFSLALAERARLSRDLHDTLLQSLVGVTLQLGAITNVPGESPPPPPALRDRLTRIRRQVELYVEEAQQAILDLRSPTLTKRDWWSALTEFANSTVADTAITLKPRRIGLPTQFSAKQETQLLRIGREAITNAVRHGHAKCLCLELTSDGQLAKLRVVDNGCGFDVASATPDGNKHFGLVTMRERAEDISARLHISSQIGVGTTVEVLVPSRAGRGRVDSVAS